MMRVIGLFLIVSGLGLAAWLSLVSRRLRAARAHQLPIRDLLHD